jgi:hypothetical protein
MKHEIRGPRTEVRSPAFRFQVSAFILLLAAAAAPAQDTLYREITRTNNVNLTQARDAIAWYQGETIRYDLRIMRGSLAWSLPTNTIPVWSVTDASLTNFLLHTTGTVVTATNGLVRFEADAATTALTNATDYQSIVVLYQQAAGTNRYIGVGDRTSARVIANPNYTGSLVPPISDAEGLATLQALIVATGSNATTALTAANTAFTNAASAQATANAAHTNAASAQGTANSAVTNAATAQVTADAAHTNAASAQGTANSAMTNAAAAQLTADAAHTNAASAQATANTAMTNAASAQATANAAHTNAAAAQGTANSAMTNSAAAQLTADAAHTNAGLAYALAGAAVPTSSAGALAYQSAIHLGQLTNAGTLAGGYYVSNQWANAGALRFGTDYADSIGDESAFAQGILVYNDMFSAGYRMSNSTVLATWMGLGGLSKSNSLTVADVAGLGGLAESNSIRLANIADAGTAAAAPSNAFVRADRDVEWVSLGYPVLVTTFLATVPGGFGYGIGYASNAYRTARWWLPYTCTATGALLATQWACQTGEPSRVYNVAIYHAVSNGGHFGTVPMNPTNAALRHSNGWGYLSLTNTIRVPYGCENHALLLDNGAPPAGTQAYSNYLVNPPSLKFLYP